MNWCKMISNIYFSRKKEKYKRQCSVCYLLCKIEEENKSYTNLFFCFSKKKHREIKSENNEISYPSLPTKRNQEVP